MKKGLAAISLRTEKLWNEVVEKYGRHTYVLAVNGLNEVVLSKGYTEDMAKGNREVQKILWDLLRQMCTHLLYC